MGVSSPPPRPPLPTFPPPPAVPSSTPSSALPSPPAPPDKATAHPAMRLPPPPAEQYREWRVLPVATLTSIATVIGSGILALPVTLYRTAVPVFLLLFTVSMLAQVAVVYAIIELLQRARLAATDPLHPPDPPSPASYDAIPEPAPKPLVSLFSIADLYLPNPWLRALYFVTTFLGFMTIMVSYGLAGPQAVWQLLSSGPQHLAPPSLVFYLYWFLGTGAVVFFVDQLLGVFGSFTVLKGALFVGVVAIVASLPDAAHVQTMSSLLHDFSGLRHAAAPFLMSCVALGGVANTTPVTFNLLPAKPTHAQVARYRRAMVLAVVLCYLLNVGWVLAVLQVVPRNAADGSASLTLAYNQGQISTIPLIDALHAGDAVHGGVLRAIEVIVEMFIFVSTGVSYFVTAAGMKSFVDGAVATVAPSLPVFRRQSVAWLPTAAAYAVSFGSVLLIIVTNPDGFIAVLTRFTSFTLNLQAGAMLFLMLFHSRAVERLRPGTSGASVGIDQSETAAGDASGQPRDGRHDADDSYGSLVYNIPLAMSPFTASTFITFGTLFFASACLLAALGPMLGVKLGGRE